jgi:ribosomal protein L31
MKAEIHPEYVLATVHCSCGNTFQTRSTKPELHVEICAQCHPFYTGKQKLVDTGGRVERFQRRLEKAGRARGLHPMSQAIGGQAVLEGVMMRGPRNWAVAVRKPDGQIAQVAKPIDPLMARHWTLRLPVVRGVVALGESLAIGFRALSVSANYAAQEELEGDEEPAEIGRWALFFSFAIAIGFALMLFKVGPALLTDWLPISSDGWFVIVEGLIRVTVFILYLTLLSLIPSLRRVFQYHAAEHKAINAYEAGEELTPQVAQRYSLIHPRCGTAFLLWVMVIGVFVFALFGRLPWYWLIASRIALLPVIAGIAYEVIRFAGKHQDNRILMTLLAPGLWLQRLTTREPSLDQLEVSIRALREVLEREGRLTPADRRVEVMA